MIADLAGGFKVSGDPGDQLLAALTDAGRNRVGFAGISTGLFTVALWRTCGRQNQVFGTHPAALTTSS